MNAARQRAGRIGGALALASAVFFTNPGHSLASGDCADPPMQGGDWPSYGHDLSNTRTQPAETTIGLTNAREIETAFVFRGPGAAGTVNSTPVVAGGCVFITSSDDATHASVTAIDADDGTLRWSHPIDVGAAAYGGAIVGSPVVHGDLVIAPVNRKAGPFAIALHRDTGTVAWESDPVDTQPSSGTNAGITVWDDLVFFGFFGAAGPWTAERGGFALLDANDGTILEKTYTIPDAHFDASAGRNTYAGAGIWGTAVVDAHTGFAYVGTSNPHNPQKVHERSTSILKIDLNRTSDAFGQIVDVYQGFRDTMTPAAVEQGAGVHPEHNPACTAAPGVYYTGSFSATCLAVDVDFGASPNLIETGGRTLVGAQQKSGTYHLVNTSSMDGVSMTQVGAPCFACSAASSAYAAGRAFVPAGPPGQLVAVDVGTLDTGVPAWASPVAGGFTYNPASVANGLVWMTDSAGFLDAFDALTGAPILKLPMQNATGTSMVTTTSSGGVAIANNTIYAALGSYVVAYALPT
ncbi:MAG: outer membrane protein assembly factor BamB family protein [Microthrixaceae bacterium]